MSDWNYTFDPISKADWLEQITADLRPRGFDSIESEWWPGEKMVPTLRTDDAQPPIKLSGQLFEQPPHIIEWIDTSLEDAKTINQKILNSLNYGSQSLILHIDHDKKMPIRLWLDGVFTDLIDINISLDRESPEIIHAVREIIPKSALIRLNRKNHDQSSSVFLEALQGSTDENAKSYRFIYEFPATGLWTKQTAEIFQLMINDLVYWTSQGFNKMDYLENCVLVFTPDTHYLKQLIQTRVLHLVWNNLWQFYTKNQRITSSYLECHILQGKFQDPDLHLVRSSASALSASLTGLHFICIHHLTGKEIPSHYSRADRNIHHLLNMESGMYTGTDPLAGSYSLDYYTHLWTSAIWKSLQF